MTGLYFSGTGNTKHCVEQFLSYFDDKSKTVSIEDFTPQTIINDDTIVLGYPIYVSDLPMIMRDFIIHKPYLFSGKKVFIIVTMTLFSGDGSGCAARLLQKYGANIVGGLHLRMPDCIGDIKLFKRPFAKNLELIRCANEKIRLSAKCYKDAHPTQDGLGKISQLAGFLSQRMWAFGKEKTYKDKPEIDITKCVKCGTCVQNCPMKNLQIKSDMLEHGSKCTMCYRCVNHCPEQALTIIGKRVVEQCYFQKYAV